MTDESIISLIVQLAPYGVQIILALIDLFRLLIERGHSPDAVASVSQLIIDGINEGHPDWSVEERARYARDAISKWAEKHAPQLA